MRLSLIGYNTIREWKKLNMFILSRMLESCSNRNCDRRLNVSIFSLWYHIQGSLSWSAPHGLDGPVIGRIVSPYSRLQSIRALQPIYPACTCCDEDRWLGRHLAELIVYSRRSITWSNSPATHNYSPLALNLGIQWCRLPNGFWFTGSSAG